VGKLIFLFQFCLQFWVIFSTIVGIIHYWVISLKSILPNMVGLKYCTEKMGKIYFTSNRVILNIFCDGSQLQDKNRIQILADELKFNPMIRFHDFLPSGDEITQSARGHHPWNSLEN
jgi:hypothetical protein